METSFIALATLKRISLAEMVLHRNPRKDLKDIKGLTASIIAAPGITQPLTGFESNVDGKTVFQVVDGQRRYTSLLLIKESGEHAELLENIPFLVFPAGISEKDILKHQILSNEGEPLSPLELGDAIVEFLESGMSVAEVAQDLGKSRAYIGELKRLSELPEYIKALIRKGTLSATLVREQIKAGNLEAFIANINENGIEGDDLPSEDVSAEIEAKTGQKAKVTQKDLEKNNSIKEFKNFAKNFSEIFPDDVKRQIYEFATGLIHNEFNGDQILAFFTDEKTAKFNTDEKNVLRTKAAKSAGKKNKAAANGNSYDNQLSLGAPADTTATGTEANEGAENADNGQDLQLPEPVEVSNGKKGGAKKKAAPKKAAAKKTAKKSSPRKIGYEKSTGKAN
jgi:ParB/RepB/Spo0J family partition protein